ncbi:MAG TPA: glycosyltransferase [Patescibacteria group bacterium]|nr:glycosyltransferase [Patescibacteria group bacterium]
MRILWIKVGGLWPPDAGGRLRSLHLLSELARRHRVTLLTTHGPGDDPGTLRARLDRCEVISVPWTIPKRGSAAFVRALLRSWLTPHPVDLVKFRVPALRAALRRRAETGADDLWVVDFLSATASLPRGATPPTLLFAHNIEHVIWRRLAAVESGPLRRLLLGIEWRKMRRAEARACADATMTVAVSDGDAAQFSSLAPGARVTSIPTGVDTAYFTPARPRSERPEIVFIGSMDWHPNEDAVLHFLGSILPVVRREIPGVTFTVVGRNPGPRLRALAGEEGVGVTGTVPDVRPYLAPAALCVVPLRVGGGTRLKIFEALAMGKAVVSTSVGAEGLPLVDGVHYLRADAPANFARAVVLLLRDPERRAALGDAGRALVETRHAWAQVADEFELRGRETVLAAAGETPPAARGRLARLLPGVLVRHARALRDLRAGRGRYGVIQVRRLLGLGVAARPAPPARVVLYVCRGNIIRSPMAEALLRSALASAGSNGAIAASAGLYARRGQPADPRAIRAARSFGLSLEEHRARLVTERMVAEADLIVPMDSFIEADLCGRYPQARDRIHPFHESRAGRRPRAVEILDPHEGGLEDVRRCYELLRACVLRQAETLIKRSGADGARLLTEQEDRPCA